MNQLKEDNLVFDNNDLKEVNGKKIIRKFKVLHHLWECDGYGYLSENGDIFMTSHGWPINAEESVTDFQFVLKETENILNEMKEIEKLSKKIKNK